MTVDELFTQTETDLDVLNRRLSGDYTDITSFNEACVSAGYDMMLLFVGRRYTDKQIQTFIEQFGEYLSVVCSDYSALYIEKDKSNESEEMYIVWWIQKPEKFEELLQLTYYMYRFRFMNKRDRTSTLTAYIVTAENRDEIENLRTFVYPLGLILNFSGTRSPGDSIASYLKRNFTLFWNNLNQQQQLFTSSYYGREIDSLDSFICIFSHFVARKICIALKQDKRTQLNRLTYEWYRETVRKQVTKIFDER